MKINDKYEIVSDVLNVTLVEHFFTQPVEATESTPYVPPKPRTRTIGYFSSPKGALMHLLDREVMGSGMKDLQTVCDVLDKLKNDIKKLDI